MSQLSPKRKLAQQSAIVGNLNELIKEGRFNLQTARWQLDTLQQELEVLAQESRGRRLRHGNSCKPARTLRGPTPYQTPSPALVPKLLSSVCYVNAANVNET